MIWSPFCTHIPILFSPPFFARLLPACRPVMLPFSSFFPFLPVPESDLLFPAPNKHTLTYNGNEICKKCAPRLQAALSLLSFAAVLPDHVRSCPARLSLLPLLL